MSILFSPQTMRYESHKVPEYDPGPRRARTQPGAMRVAFDGVADDDTDGQLIEKIPIRRRTQKDQDDADEAARRKAMKDLVQSWMDRLQLISVITTFFASAEAGLLQITTPDRGDKNTSDGLEQATNAALVGALVMHIFAAIISFMAAFLLIRYKLKEAKKEELKVENKDGTIVATPVASSPVDIECGSEDTNKTKFPFFPMPSTNGIQRQHSQAIEPPIFTSDPHIEQVGPFRRSPPSNLLSRCHTLCILLSVIGFVLALLGITCFAWARHPIGVSVFGTACLSFCLMASVSVLL